MCLAFTSAAETGAGEYTDPQPHVVVANRVNLRYAHGGVPTVLGPLDRLAYALPVHELTFGTVTADGVEARITNWLVREYRLNGDWNFERGPENNPVPLENNSLVEGFLALPLGYGQIVLGRQNVHVGPESRNSLLISESIPYLDAVRMNVDLGRWDMTQVIATLENRSTAPDRALPAADDYGFGQTVILLSSRRFAWHSPKLEIGIGAQALLTRVNNAFHLGDVLPVFSIHNGDVGPNNLSTTLDVTSRFFAGHTQYAMVGFDDINANVVGVGDSGVPTIWAILAGGNGAVHLPGIVLRYNADFGITHYLWGSYDDHLYLSRSIYRMRTDGRAIALPLSSPYGPARLSAELDIDAEITRTRTSIGLRSLVLYGDPSIDLFSTTYEATDSHLEPILFRNELRVEQRLRFGVVAALGVGVDVVPEEASSWVSVQVGWSSGSIVNLAPDE